MNPRLIRRGACFLVLGFVLIMASSAHAIRKPVVGAPTAGFKPTRAFISFGVINRNLGGDFDGETYLVTSGLETIWLAVLPEFGSGSGFEGAIGGREGDMGGEIAVAYTNHSGPWAGKRFDGSMLSLGLYLFVYGRSSSRIQPFLQLGIMFQDVSVKNGSMMISSTGDIFEGKASYSGLGGRFGGGVQFYLCNFFSIRTTALYRIGSLRRVRISTRGSLEIEDGLSSSGISLLAQTILGFG